MFIMFTLTIILMWVLYACLKVGAQADESMEQMYKKHKEQN